MAGPLEGIRILDLTTFTQGGEATGFLRDLGADVIKVESRDGGDPGRRMTVVDGGLSTFFLPQNRGKRSITLDLRRPEGRAIVLRLAEQCDAFVHNFRPGVVERLGLDYESVCAVNPAIVYAEASGFGSEGPDARLPAVDIVVQARGGLAAVTGDGEPRPAGAIVCDYTGAMHLALGVLSALIARGRTGRGQKVEGSMLGSMVGLQGWEFTHYLITGRHPRPSGVGHQLLSPLYSLFQTRDGYIAIAGVGPQAWAGFVSLLGCPELGETPLTYGSTPPEQEEALVARLRAACRERASQELLAGLRQLGIRCAPVQDYAQLAADPQVEANGYIVEGSHPAHGTLRMAGNPLRFSDTPLAIPPTAPALGEHTDEILRALGFPEQEIADLRERRVV